MLCVSTCSLSARLDLANMSLSTRVARRELSRPLYLERRALLWNASRCYSSGRRLRRLKPARSRWDTEFKMPDVGGLGAAFEPDEDMNEYLKKVSLSPWVPTPDPVARRVLDLLHANKDDVSQYFFLAVRQAGNLPMLSIPTFFLLTCCVLNGSCLLHRLM